MPTGAAQDNNKNDARASLQKPAKKSKRTQQPKGETKMAADKPNKAASNSEKASRLKAVELAVEQIQRQFGTGSIMRLGEGIHNHVETVPTGSLSLDIALGGGIPRGRIIEIYGPESSGKTTLSLHILAEVQKTGGTAAFVDAEHALDPEYASKIGVDLDDPLGS